jgi:hypothetical protein
MAGDFADNLGKRFEASTVHDHMVKVPLEVDLRIVEPKPLSERVADRTSPQRLDQAVALHDARLEQLVGTCVRHARAIQDKRRQNMQGLRRCLSEKEQGVEI